ncbi:MAG: hypothetical protein K6L81_08995 [Agarilytica sp.]
MYKIIFTLISLTFSLQSYALNDAEVNRYLKLLKFGCSVDAGTELELSTDGQLVILGKKKMGGASFELSSSMRESILHALSNESLKGDQATEQRNCQKRYLDKIFDLVEKGSEKATLNDSATIAEDGVIYDILGCVKSNRTNLTCKLAITSASFDKKIRLRPVMFDNAGNQYFAKKIRIANFSKKSKSLSVPLIADVETKGVITFVNVHSQAEYISKLTLLESVVFKGIPISQDG